MPALVGSPIMAKAAKPTVRVNTTVRAAAAPEGVGRRAAAAGSLLQGAGLAALSGFVLPGCWGVGHNFMHQAQDKAGATLPLGMDLSGTPSSSWRMTHGLSHHLETNLETDFEYMNAFADYRSPENTIGKAIPVLAPFFCDFSLVNNLINLRKEARPGGPGMPPIQDALGHLLPLLTLLSYMWGRRSIPKGLLLYIIQGVAFSLLWVPLGGGVHHAAPTPGSPEDQELQSGSDRRNTYAWMEGQAGARKDFGAHQLLSTSDHTIIPDWVPAFVRDWISLTFFGYLNNHKLHHLFPGVDHSRLWELREVMEETAREFGLQEKDIKPFPLASIWAGWYRYNRSRQYRSRL